MDDLKDVSVIAEFQVIEGRPEKCPHGPFGFANILPDQPIEGSFTFLIEPKDEKEESAWIGDQNELHGGRRIVGWDIVWDKPGYKARRARLWRIGDDDPETRDKRNREIEK